MQAMNAISKYASEDKMKKWDIYTIPGYIVYVAGENKIIVNGLSIINGLKATI